MRFSRIPNRAITFLPVQIKKKQAVPERTVLTPGCLRIRNTRTVPEERQPGRGTVRLPPCEDVQQKRRTVLPKL